MDRQRKGFWEFFIEDTVSNLPFYTTAEVVNVETDGVLITYTDRHGEPQTKKIIIEGTSQYNLGDKLDIQVCGGRFPSIFAVPHKDFLQG